MLSNEGTVAVVCTITATAEYCEEVVGALSRNVCQYTLDPPFGAQVRTPCCSWIYLSQLNLKLVIP